jgi:hypothetical protein
VRPYQNAANVRGWILWNEYVERNPEGLPILPLLRAVPKLGGQALGYNAPDVGGDKLFVDYAGDTVPVIIDRLTDFVGSGMGNSHVTESTGLNRIGARRGSPGVGVRKWRRVQYA